MGGQTQVIRVEGLLMFLLAYAGASLVHHVHNAQFLSDYPNMPASLSPAGVYAAWLGVSSVGLIGYLFVRRGHQLVGFVTLAVYGVLGFLGLGHYMLAPISAHTLTMNLTIWLEVATAVLLLIAVAGRMARRLRGIVGSGR